MRSPNVKFKALLHPSLTQWLCVIAWASCIETLSLRISCYHRLNLQNQRSKLLTLACLASSVQTKWQPPLAGLPATLHLKFSPDSPMTNDVISGASGSSCSSYLVAIYPSSTRTTSSYLKRLKRGNTTCQKKFGSTFLTKEKTWLLGCSFCSLTSV